MGEIPSLPPGTYSLIVAGSYVLALPAVQVSQAFAVIEGSATVVALS